MPRVPPRRLILLVGAIVAVDTMFYAAITPLLPHYRAELGLSKAAAGVLAGAFPAGTLLGSLPGGWLATRAGVKPTVLVGLAFMAASSVAFAFAPSVEVLDAARFVQGWASAASWAGALAWLIGAAPRERRGELIGGAFGAAIAGALLGPVLGGIADEVGPRVAFCGVAVLGGTLAAASWLTPASQPERASRLADAVRAVRDERVRAGMWLIAMPGLLFGTVGVLAPLRMSALGAGGAAIAAVFLVVAGIEAVVSPVVGRISDRRGRLAPVRASLLACTVLFALLALRSPLAVLIVLLLATAPAIGPLWAPASALLSDGAEALALDQGYAFALLNLAWAAGQVVGNGAGASVAQATSDALPYALLAGVCAATLARRGGRVARAAGEDAPVAA